MITITREAVETLAKQEGMSPLACINLLQAGAAHMNDDERTLGALCAIKAELLAESVPASPPQYVPVIPKTPEDVEFYLGT